MRRDQESRPAGMGGVDVEACAEILERATPLRPRILVALGSGLGGLTEVLTEAVSVPLHTLPGMPAPGVAGHAGRLVAGRLAGVPVWIQDGRLHVYEGCPASLVAAPIRVAARLGVDVVILTNAAGGIRWDLGAGAVVLLSDLLNLSLRDPLRIPAENVERDGAEHEVFDPSLQELVLEIAARRDGGRVGRPGRHGDRAADRGSEGVDSEGSAERALRLSRGTYAGVLGPSFETPAEIRMIRRLGGDVVGMSTVPEALTARELGMRTVGLSLVTNRAAGLRRAALSHEEVVSAAETHGPVLASLIRDVVRELDHRRSGPAAGPGSVLEKECAIRYDQASDEPGIDGGATK